MKMNVHRFLMLALFSPCATSNIFAQEPAALPEWNGKPAVIHATTGRAPWVGFEVTRADDVVRAQLPKLPKGVGFVITSVTDQGPSRLAGLQAFDVLWKWNEQLLVNEAQLAVLLDMRAVGDTVQLTIFRAGEEKTMNVVLGAEPDRKAVAAGPTIESTKTPTMVPQLQSPRPLDVNTRMARLEDGNAVLEMESRAEGTWLTITDQQGEVVFEGFFDEQTKKKIPPVWLDRVAALHRSLQDRMCQKESADETRKVPHKDREVLPVTPVSAPSR
ncbi:MAG: hypothetical protein RI957_601 [Verrucomicrobiota bacterium]|jgi:hypothetical protein